MTEQKIVGYCCRCKTKREMKNISEIMTKKNSKMVKGLCSICNSKMCKITGKKNEKT